MKASRPAPDLDERHPSMPKARRHPRETGVRPDRGEEDADIAEAIGIDQPAG
jgi:hypothetical protein